MATELCTDRLPYFSKLRLSLFSEKKSIFEKRNEDILEKKIPLEFELKINPSQTSHFPKSQNYLYLEIFLKYPSFSTYFINVGKRFVGTHTQ